MIYNPYNDIEQAAYEIGVFCRTWGRINVTQMKEKYGTSRVYSSFGWYSFHSIFYPGYVYYQWSGQLAKLDDIIGTRIVPLFNWAIIPCQIYIYKLAYKRAIKKYPQIKENIIDGADYAEFLT